MEAVSRQSIKARIEEKAEKLKDRGIESYTDEEYRSLVEEAVFSGDTGMRVSELSDLIEDIYIRTRSRLGVLAPLCEDSAIMEIMVNGKEDLFVETSEGIRRLDPIFESTEELEEIIRNIAAACHREINEMNPILDARLANGARVNAVYKNVAMSGPVLTIRKFSRERITMGQMIGSDTISSEAAELLKMLVEKGYNIFISGGTSSGKTTFLNALSDYIPEEERVIVIEDSRELSLSHIGNIVQMECHNANSLGKGRVSMDMLIRTSLRMRPDRIIVGEVRGSEVSDMLQAMNTGHDGSMSTGHGNSVKGMLRRLESMYLMASELPIDAIRAQIVEGIDIMVHLARLSDGQRRVMEIQELLDHKSAGYLLNPLYIAEEGRLEATGNDLVNRGKLLQG